MPKWHILIFFDVCNGVMSCQHSAWNDLILCVWEQCSLRDEYSIKRRNSFVLDASSQFYAIKLVSPSRITIHLFLCVF